MTQEKYTPRVGDWAVMIKKTKSGNSVGIEGTIESVLDHAEHGLSIRFEGLDGYINIDKKSSIQKVEL
ncbi:hypothetical protein UFOVP609_44 [uncultured Caudovirales phage]|uniref:Uncharacterized protein n=1 Tax=uncultured Caudovirales phage TaxID=2100421 RepID=A0A6J5N6T1_9CAUD|nr:hypothetical protein UFOVP609_44 [uncultured Caudovirales phage]